MYCRRIFDCHPGVTPVTCGKDPKLVETGLVAVGASLFVYAVTSFCSLRACSGINTVLFRRGCSVERTRQRGTYAAPRIPHICLPRAMAGRHSSSARPLKTLFATVVELRRGDKDGGGGIAQSVLRSMREVMPQFEANVVQAALACLFLGVFFARILSRAVPRPERTCLE